MFVSLGYVNGVDDVVLQADLLSVRHGARGRNLCTNLSLVLRRSEALEIAGPNGCGKSTLLRTLVGLHRCGDGKVEKCHRIGFVPSGWLPPRISVNELLLGFARMNGCLVAAERATMLLDNLGFQQSGAALLPDLSTGSARKVVLAVALMAEPELLVLDEPWAGLDKSSQATLCELLGEHCNNGGAVIGVDHHGFLGTLSAGRTLNIAPAQHRQATIILAEGARNLAQPNLPEAISHSLSYSERSSTQLLTLMPAPELVDDTLRALLSAGWSIREVRAGTNTTGQKPLS